MNAKPVQQMVIQMATPMAIQMATAQIQFLLDQIIIPHGVLLVTRKQGET